MYKIINYCKNNNYNELEKSLKSDHDLVNRTDRWGRRLIYYAVLAGSTESVKTLLETGQLNISLTSKVHRICKYEAPIFTSIRTNQPGIFDLLTKNHCTKSAKEYLAAILKKSNSSFFLIYLNNFQIISLKGLEIILCAYARVEHFQILDNRQICYDLLNSLKYTLLYRKYGAFNYLLRRIKYSEQINHIFFQKNKLPHQISLLAMAIIQGYLKGVQRLISLGADITGFVVNSNNESFNYIMYLCSNRNYHTETAQRQQSILDTLEYLISQGLSVDYQNNTGLTALMVAAKIMNKDYIEVLLRYGADKSLRDMNNKSAVDYLVNAKSNFGKMESNSDYCEIKELL